MPIQKINKKVKEPFVVSEASDELQFDFSDVDKIVKNKSASTSNSTPTSVDNVGWVFSDIQEVSTEPSTSDKSTSNTEQFDFSDVDSILSTTKPVGKVGEFGES